MADEQKPNVCGKCKYFGCCFRCDSVATFCLRTNYGVATACQKMFYTREIETVENSLFY